jgi:hypothetical protein
MTGSYDRRHGSGGNVGSSVRAEQKQGDEFPERTAV